MVLLVVVPVLILTSEIAGMICLVFSLRLADGRRCPQCFYDLRGHTAAMPRCPECGTTVVATRWRHQRIVRSLFWLGIFLMLLPYLAIVGISAVLVLAAQ